MLSMENQNLQSVTEWELLFIDGVAKCFMQKLVPVTDDIDRIGEPLSSIRRL